MGEGYAGNIAHIRATAVPEPEAKYYWYVGTTEPTELNGAVANAETDKWVEIGTDLSAVKYITIDTSEKPDYSFPAWYVLMPTSLGFKPHNSDGTKDESSAWDISDSSIEGYTLYVVDEGTLEAVFSTFKKEGSLPYDENADYWYLGQTDPSTRTEIYPIALQNWAIDDAWEEIVNFSEKIEVNKQPADWDFDSFTALWYVAMPASSGYTPQDADLWEISTATIAGKDYIVYKSEGKVWELNTAFLPEGYVEEEIAVSDIALDQTAATLTEGETLTLKATVSPDDATDKTVTWSTSDASVATVVDGVVTAVAAGSATITAKAGDKEATCVVTVEKKEEPLPAVPSGEYYLYHAESKRFLSRGEYWGTCATVDRYGIPFVWTAEEYSLKFLDSNVHLFETDDSNIYTDNNSTGFTFEAVEGGYLLKSQKSDRYLTIGNAAFTHQIVNVTDDASAAVVWQLKSKAEHDAIVAGYVEENYANVIKAAGLTATEGDFVSYLSTLTATDMTSAIGTARFAGSAGDWTFTEVRHQDWQPAYGADFCELWQATGSYTQTITGLAEGIYKVTVQGFERSGGWATCNTLAEKGYEISTATLSANGEETNLKSWYSGKSGESNPNNTGEAVAKFAEGLYQSEVYTYVGKDGTLTLTLCKPSHVGDNWVLFNNFTLTRYAEGGTGVGQWTMDNSQLTIYDLMGRKVENPAKGIYIINGRKVVIK